MARNTYAAERVIPAPAEALYALLADYRVGHSRILPPAFSDYAVLEGGAGAGTRIRFRFTVTGRSQPMEGAFPSRSRAGYCAKPTRTAP